LHVSGNAILTGDIQIGTGTVAISGSAGTISASGAISASDLFLGGGSDSFIDVDGHITASGAVSASGTGLFGALKINGTDYLGNPTTLSELDESTDATDDKIILWDQNASAWKYMTLDNLQDSIDTTGGGGGGISFDGSTADGITTFKDSDEVTVESNLTFNSSNQLTVTGEITASGNISSSGNITANNPSLTYASSSISTLANGEGYGEIIDAFVKHGSVSAGDVVANIGGTWRGADANGATDPFKKSMIGVALSGTQVLLRGVVRLGAGHIHDTKGIEEGSELYLSTEASHVQYAVPGSGAVARLVGYTIDDSKDIIYFNPSNTFVEVS